MNEPGARPQPSFVPKTGTRAWWGTVVPAPTPRLVVAVVVAAFVGALLPTSVVLVAPVLALLVVVDTTRTVAPWRVPVAREVPSTVVLGATAELSWHVVNPNETPLLVQVADDLAPSLRPGARRARLDLPPLTSGVATTTIRPSRRGRRSPEELTVRVTSPWGLVTRQHRRTLVSRLDVHPTFRSRRATELRITRGRILEAGIRSARALGRGTDFEQLREYAPDDEFRRIDWGATARRGTPIVRTYREERNQTVHVLLDSGRTMAGLVGDVPRLDHAMDAVLALGTAATRLGDKVGLLAYSSRLRAEVAPDGRQGQVTALAEAMFALEPELAEADHELAITHTIARHRRRSLLVVLTELSGDALTELLVPSLPLLLRHHVVVVAATRDPDVERWRTDAPDDVDAVYRAAGAVTVARARDRTAALLQRLGAIVVDAPEGDLAVRVVDAYLGVKATGRL